MGTFATLIFTLRTMRETSCGAVDAKTRCGTWPSSSTPLNGKPYNAASLSGRMLEDAFTLLIRDESFRYVAVSVADTSPQVGTVTPAPESRRGRKAASSVAG